MSVLPWIATGMLGWGIVLLVTPFLLKHCAAICQGRPRELHHTQGAPISRVGGLSLAVAYIAIQCFAGVLFPQGDALSQWIITLAPLAMFGLGFWDDWQALGAKTKLAVQVLIALAVSHAGVEIESPQFGLAKDFIAPGIWKVILTVGWLVGFTNLINLADGVDGLALSLGLILMMALAALAGVAAPLSWFLAGTLGALVALLSYNFHPARVYLGDGGAYFLGFQLGLFSLLATRARSDSVALVIPLCGVALPLLDTLLAIARRALKGLPIFRPDRNHLHHYLLQQGLTPRRVVCWYSLITLLFLLAGAAAVFWPAIFSLLIALAASALVLVLCRRKVLGYLRWRQLQAKLRFWPGVRRQIAYALCLQRWLEHEAQRCSSVEELFGDLKVAAQRLGFTSLRLRLADGDRTWKRPGDYGPLVSTSHLLEGGHLGVLELAAPRHRLGVRPAKGSATGRCGTPWHPVPNDPRLIELLAELLAESWIEAARAWHLGRAQLRFDHPLAQIGVVPRRESPGYSPYSAVTHTAVQVNGLHQIPSTASSTGGVLRRTCWLVLGVFFLNSTCGSGQDLATTVQTALSGVPRLELPARAARLVKAAHPTERRAVTVEAIKATVKVSPAVIPAVVGSIAKTVPDMAAPAAGEAARQAPKQACAIARAAAATAPNQARAVVLSVCRIVPSEYQNISLAVAEVVPEASREILDALAVLFPELRATIAPSLASPTRNPSVATVLKSTGPVKPDPFPRRTDPSPVNGSPLGNGPSLGPPFAPFSGTATNMTPSTSGTVPEGGRNYATP